MSATVRRPQLRITLNSRCGRACFYCRPSGEAVTTAPGLAIDPDDLVFFVAAAADFGLRDIKLTGGDPALYTPLVETVHALRERTAVETIEVISRHPRIGELAGRLADAGVDKFNVSLDTLDPGLHKRICGVDDLPALIGAITQLVDTGVPVKLNTVVMAGVNDGEIFELAEFAAAAGVESLKLLDVIDDLDTGSEAFARRLRRETGASSLKDLYAPMKEITRSLAEQAVSVGVQYQGGLGHPMSVYGLPTGLRVIVKDAAAGAWYGPVCNGCPFFPCHDALMALRLTADLRAQFCLLREDIVVDLSAIIAARSRQELDATLGEICAQYSRAEFATSAGPSRPQQPAMLHELPLIQGARDAR